MSYGCDSITQWGGTWEPRLPQLGRAPGTVTPPSSATRREGVVDRLKPAGSRTYALAAGGFSSRPVRSYSRPHLPWA